MRACPERFGGLHLRLGRQRTRSLSGRLLPAAVKSSPCRSRQVTRNQPGSEESPEIADTSETGVVIEVVGQDSAQPIVDQDLLFVAEKWASLPAAIRAGVVAMINGLLSASFGESPDALALNQRRSLKA